MAARLAWVCALTLLTAAPAFAAGERLDFPLRGQHLTLTVYRPAVPKAQVRGTILMGSGDVGWVGLAASMADFLRSAGYVVVGLNVREYLASFTTRAGGHLTPEEVGADYSSMAELLRKNDLLYPKVIVSGVSEGAGLAVLAAAARTNHPWIRGVITMGLPATVELAWRWSDFTAWITKRNSGEPAFAAKDYLAAIAPRPLYMIQSTRDEYVTEHDYRELEAAARPPKRLALIAAGNHRFTDRIPELRSEYITALAWIEANGT